MNTNYETILDFEFAVQTEMQKMANLDLSDIAECTDMNIGIVSRYYDNNQTPNECSKYLIEMSK